MADKLTVTHDCGSMGKITSTHFPGDVWTIGSFDPGMGRMPEFGAMSSDGRVKYTMWEAEAREFAGQSTAQIEQAIKDDAYRNEKWIKIHYTRH